jgi:hypothetical protein
MNTPLAPVDGLVQLRMHVHELKSSWENGASRFRLEDEED